MGGATGDGVGVGVGVVDGSGTDASVATTVTVLPTWTTDPAATNAERTVSAVSYTHLDVYKRQGAKIAIGGGCAMNAVLISALRGHLEDAGAILLEARQAPPNDGGLALGQGWVARRMVRDTFRET